MSVLTWLHLSDLHYQTDDRHDRQTVLEPLWDDIKKQVDEGLQLDFIAFTGDVAKTGKEEEYEQAVEHFFEPLLAATGVPKRRLFIIPGNHDIDWDLVELISEDIPTLANDRSWLNDLLDSPLRRGLIFYPFRAYTEFIKNYLGDEQKFDEPAYFYTRRLEVDDKAVGLIAVNSAWLCGFTRNAEGEVADHGNLLIGETQVADALRGVGEVDVQIVLMHHPLSWIREFDANDVKLWLRSKCHFVLHGHLHQPYVEVVHAPPGRIVYVPAGAAYNRPEHLNGYNIVRLDFESGQGTAYLRRYSDQLHRWRSDIDSAGGDEHGRIVFNLPRALLPAQLPEDRRDMPRLEAELSDSSEAERDNWIVPVRLALRLGFNVQIKMDDPAGPRIIFEPLDTKSLAQLMVALSGESRSEEILAQFQGASTLGPSAFSVPSHILAEWRRRTVRLDQIERLQLLARRDPGEAAREYYKSRQMAEQEWKDEGLIASLEEVWHMIDAQPWQEPLLEEAAQRFGAYEALDAQAAARLVLALDPDNRSAKNLKLAAELLLAYQSHGNEGWADDVA